MTEDVPRYPGVHRRPDSNIFQFGLRVPVDLRDRFATPWAVRCSLQTADIRAANAKAKGLQADWEVRFQALRTGQEPSEQPEPAPDLHALRLALLARIEAALSRIDVRIAGMGEAKRRDEVESARWVLETGRDALAGGYVDDVGAEDWVREYAPARHPAAVAEVQAARVLLSELFVEALEDASRAFPLRVRRLQERRALLALQVPLQGSERAVANGPAVAGVLLPPHGHRIMDAFAIWGRMTRPAKTVSKFKNHVQRFMLMANDPVLEGFNKLAAIKLRNDLQSWAIAEGKTAVTADNVLISIRAIFSVARDQGWIESNPFTGLAVKHGGRQTEGREPWTQEELQALFADAIWAEHRMPVDKKAGREAA